VIAAKEAAATSHSKRVPPAIGREALIGLPVTAVSACLPEGWVKLRGERWKARCSEGAGVGDPLVVEAVERDHPDRRSAAIESDSLTRERPVRPAE
jgi:membrane-bound ClpP family serine protease